jgi:hypothetical protein
MSYSQLSQARFPRKLDELKGRCHIFLRSDLEHYPVGVSCWARNPRIELEGFRALLQILFHETDVDLPVCLEVGVLPAEKKKEASAEQSHLQTDECPQAPSSYLSLQQSKYDSCINEGQPEQGHARDVGR